MLQPKDRLAEWIQKQDPYTCCLQEIHFRHKETYKLKVRGWKNIFLANGKQKKAGVEILISDKVQFSRAVVSDFLQPHESQHARPLCPSLTPGVHSDSRPLS